MKQHQASAFLSVSDTPTPVVSFRSTPSVASLLASRASSFLLRRLRASVCVCVRKGVWPALPPAVPHSRTMKQRKADVGHHVGARETAARAPSFLRFFHI